jgi:hypothetical protein
MKIVSQDSNRLVTSDKSISTPIVSFIVSIVVLAVAYQGLVSHQATLVIGGIAIFLVIVFFGIIGKKTRTLVIDKQAGQVSLSSSSIVKHSQVSYPIASIQRVHQIDKYQSQTTGQTISLSLIMSDGTSVIVASANQGLSSGARKTARVVGQAISTFLSIPFDQGSSFLGKEVASTVVNTPVSGNAEPSAAPTQPQPPVEPVDSSSNQPGPNQSL